MAEYIGKQALLKKMYASHSVPLLISQMTDEDIMFKTMVSIVEEQPTADVVEVVRCGQCKHCKQNSYTKKYVCTKTPNANVVKSEHYCGYGERKCENGKQ